MILDWMTSWSAGLGWAGAHAFVFESDAAGTVAAGESYLPRYDRRRRAAGISIN